MINTTKSKLILTMVISLKIPQQLKTSWFTVTAFIGLSLIVLIILVLSHDALRIRSNIISPHKRLKQRHLKKQEEQEDSVNLAQRVNLGSDSTLPEDYFMCVNCSSGYGSTIINDTIKEEEEILQDQRENQQETEAEHLPENIPQEHNLKE